MLPLRFSDLRNVQLICAHLQTTPRALQSFLREPDRYYTPIDLPQVPWRRPRRVFEVGAPLRRIHRVLAVALAQHVHEQPSYIQGFRSGRSIRSNAAMHVNAEVVVTADIRGFFDEIDIERVTSLFQRLGAPFQAATLLARLSTFQGHLPQGGRASPAISNLAVPDLDKALVRLGGRCAYTRYADDITFSGTVAACPTEDQLRAVLESCGFQLRPRSFKKQLKGSGQIVTGLSVVSGTPTLTRRKRREIERALYFGARFSLSYHAARTGSGRSPQREFARLSGHIAAAGGVDKKLHAKWVKLLESVNP